MIVWLKRTARCRRTGRCSRVAPWAPTGIGVERGSKTVSEMAVRVKNQSSPKTGRSPLSVFWLYGSRSSRDAEVLHNPPAVGDRDEVAGNAAGDGGGTARIGHGPEAAGRARRAGAALHLGQLLDPGRGPRPAWASQRPAPGPRRQARAAAGSWRGPRTVMALARRSGPAEPRKGAPGHWTQRRFPPCGLSRSARRGRARCRPRCREASPPVGPRKETMSSWAMPSPEMPMPPTTVCPR